jgi:hypothetical protein
MTKWFPTLEHISQYKTIQNKLWPWWVSTKFLKSLDELVNENHASKLMGAQTLGNPTDSYWKIR